MNRSTINPWLHRFAVGIAAATLVLLCFGGLVTSHGAGLAVPDWPNSYGYNMFLFPISKWVGGIFYEHTHRLVASGVGFLTIILAVWLWRKEERRWLRWLGWGALVLVALQGVLGGLRVTLLKDEIGIFHAALAQFFFVLVSALALFTSRWWREPGTAPTDSCQLKRLGYLVALMTVITAVQLILGAAMRHQHAGLAIPDFPLAHGQLWPRVDPDSIALYNRQRVELNAQNPITAGGIVLQMTHRLVAGLILAGVGACAWQARRKRLGCLLLTRLTLVWLGMILIQASLGVATIWSGKSADVATIHVAVGALSLMAGAMIYLVCQRFQLVPAPLPVASIPSDAKCYHATAGLHRVSEF